MPAKPSSKVRVYTVKPLSESELESGLCVPEDHPVFRSVMSYLDGQRENQFIIAAQLNGEEKTYAAAAALGAGDILRTVIGNLEDIRSGAQKKSNA